MSSNTRLGVYNVACYNAACVAWTATGNGSGGPNFGPPWRSARGQGARAACLLQLLATRPTLPLFVLAASKTVAKVMLAPAKVVVLVVMTKVVAVASNSVAVAVAKVMVVLDRDITLHWVTSTSR